MQRSPHSEIYALRDLHDAHPRAHRDDRLPRLEEYLARMTDHKIRSEKAIVNPTSLTRNSTIV
jgi:hypothetical protein